MPSSKPRYSFEEKQEEFAPELSATLKEIMSSFERNYQIWLSEHDIGGSSSRHSSSRHGSLARSEDSSVTSNAEAMEDSESSNNGRSKGRPKANCVKTNSELLPGQTIHGFVNEIIFLKNFLLKKTESKEFKTLAVVGKYGVGKTTLCKAVFNDEDVKQVYLPRLWISMYSKEDKDDHKIAIVKRLLKSLGVEEEILNYIEKEVEEESRSKHEKGEREEVSVKDKKLSTLLFTLNFILMGKKYLIILDDVWEDNEWDQKLDDDVAENQELKTHLSCGFPKGTGGRVIVTSRDEELGKKLVGEDDNLQRLYPRLDLESVWEIYRDSYEDDEGKIELKPRYPVRYKQALMEKCCGIPLAAKMLAKIEPVKIDEQGGDLEKKKGFVNSDEVMKDSLEKKKGIVNSDEGIEGNLEKKQ